MFKENVKDFTKNFNESLKKKDVTIRDRDTAKQIRVKISNLKNILRDLIEGKIKFNNVGKLI